MSNKSFQKDVPQLEGSNDDSHAKRKVFVGWNILGMKKKSKHMETGREKN